MSLKDVIIPEGLSRWLSRWLYMSL